MKRIPSRIKQLLIAIVVAMFTFGTPAWSADAAEVPVAKTAPVFTCVEGSMPTLVVLKKNGVKPSNSNVVVGTANGVLSIDATPSIIAMALVFDKNANLLQVKFPEATSVTFAGGVFTKAGNQVVACVR